MPGYVATVVVRHYFTITVDAPTAAAAGPLLCSAGDEAVTPPGWIRQYPENVDPDGVEIEVYDIERIQMTEED